MESQAEMQSVTVMVVDKVLDEGASVGSSDQLPSEGSSLAIQSYRKTKAAAAAELTGLMYEAKSARDLAWYDVGSFLTYRHTAAGELGIEMKNLYDKMGKECPDAQFYQEIADKFNNSIYRSGKSLIKWEQVYDWFQDLRSMELQSEMQSVTAMEVDKVPDEGASVGSSKALKSQLPNEGSSLAIQSYRKTKAAAAAELAGLMYEAKSARDLAWYDVASFLTYRHTAAGELEVRVRFANFGKDHDEWLNVKRCVRQRSVPLRPSECGKVKAGDVIICFRQYEDHAVYRDARVLDIERNEHNETEGCTCVFVVRYDCDFAEDRVQLSKICIRP